MIGRKIGALAAAADVQVTSSSPGLCKSGFRDGMGVVAAWFVCIGSVATVPLADIRIALVTGF